MIDLEDLQKLCICEGCKKVYMPEFAKDSGFPSKPYAVNTIKCLECKPIEEWSRQLYLKKKEGEK